jgi:hypothetical protein
MYSVNYKNSLKQTFVDWFFGAANLLARMGDEVLTAG